MKTNILILIFLVSTNIFAGNEVGNGGDGVWCSKKNSLELLDYYEAESLHRFTFEFPSETDAYQLAAKILDNFSKWDQKISSQYSRILSNMRQRSRFLKDVDFRDIKDSFEIAIPKDCELKQIAIQQKSPSKNEVEFYFHQDLWDKMKVEHQAGLLLHEIIYEHFALLGESNSIKVRYFNSFIASKELKAMTVDDYKKKIKEMKLALY